MFNEFGGLWLRLSGSPPRYKALEVTKAASDADKGGGSGPRLPAQLRTPQTATPAGRPLGRCGNPTCLPIGSGTHPHSLGETTGLVRFQVWAESCFAQLQPDGRRNHALLHPPFRSLACQTSLAVRPHGHRSATRCRSSPSCPAPPEWLPYARQSPGCGPCGCRLPGSHRMNKAPQQADRRFDISPALPLCKPGVSGEFRRGEQPRVGDPGTVEPLQNLLGA